MGFSVFRLRWLLRRLSLTADSADDDWFDQIVDTSTAIRHSILAVVVLMISLGLTVLVWHFSNLTARERAHDRFDHSVSSLESAIRDRMSDYQKVLRQTAALIGDPARLTRAQWRRFYEDIRFEQHYPGTRVYGLMLPIARADIGGYEARVRAEGFPKFRVFPPPDSDTVMPAHFMEPMDSRNVPAVGFNPLSDPARRKAIESAIATGEPTISGRITLLPDQTGRREPGLMFVMPVYSPSLPPAPTQVDRRRHLTGIVYTALGTGEVLQGVLGTPEQGIEVQIYDATQDSDETRLYASAPLPPEAKVLFSLDRRMSLYGHEWHLEARASEALMLGSERRQSVVVAIAGVIVDGVLFASVLLLSRQRKLARDGAVRMFKAFQDGEERFRLVVNAADRGFLMIDHVGRITLANAAAAHGFGYTRGAMLGMRITELIPSLEWCDALAPTLERRFSRAGEFEGAATRTQAHGVRRDGTCFPADIALTPMRFHGERFVLVAVEDISEREALERERERQLIELRRSNEDLENFAHVASHDLKAPLRAVDNLASWVEEDAGEALSDESRRHLALMRKRISRMDKLLEDLLLYGRVGRESHPVESVDLAALIDEVRDLSRQSEEFHFQVAGDQPRVRTCRVALSQVLLNLVGNAIKHHEASHGRIDIRWRTKSGWIEFEVVDDGPGIAPEYRERVFEMYQTLKPRDTLESSGMGLAIVKRIVERSGGSIAIVESTAPGTCVRFVWPAQADVAGATVALDSERAGSPRTEAGSRLGGRGAAGARRPGKAGVDHEVAIQ